MRLPVPYYQSDRVVLYHGDCLEILPHLSGVDAVVTDPPYGIADAPFTGGERAGKRVGGDNTWHPVSDWDKAINPQWCARACAVAPVVAWFGNWRKREEVAVAMTWPLRGEVVWAKDCHVGPPCPLAMRDERIWLFARDGIEGQHFETTVWDEPIIPTWARKHHKNEKPEALMGRLIRWLTRLDALILDPFSGSGTTLVAAIRDGRRAIGCETNPDYCAIAKRRIQEAEQAFALFEPVKPEQQAEMFGGAA